MLKIGGKIGKSIAIIRCGINKGKIIRLIENYNENPKNNKEYRGLNYDNKNIYLRDGIFSQYPDDNRSSERQTLYIAGPSGSGKSTYVANYLKYWQKLHPKKEIIIFSRIDKDNAFTDRNIKMSKIDIDEDLIDEPIDVDNELSDSMVIFDDINTIRDKEIKNEIIHLQEDILEAGRHSDIDIINTNHKLMDYKATRTLLNESQFVTFFTGVGNYHNKRFLKEYIGVDKKMINRILNLKSRWVTISRNYPQYCISENEIFII